MFDVVGVVAPHPAGTASAAEGSLAASAPETVVRSAQACTRLWFGMPIGSIDGGKLGRLAALGLDEVGRLAAVSSNQWIWPASGIRGVNATRVIIDTGHRAAPLVDAEVTRRTCVWSTDGVHARLHGVVLDGIGPAMAGLTVRRHPLATLRFVPWELVRLQRNGIAVASFWNTLLRFALSNADATEKLSTG